LRTRRSFRTSRRTYKSGGRWLTAITVIAISGPLGASGSGTEMIMQNVLADAETASSQDLVGARLSSIRGTVHSHPNVLPVVGGTLVMQGFGFRMLSSLEAGLPLATRISLYGPYTTGKNLAGWKGRHLRQAFYAGGSTGPAAYGIDQAVTPAFSAMIGLRLNAIDQQLTFVAENTSSAIAMTMSYHFETRLQLP
jgi:hypothetical protein